MDKEHFALVSPIGVSVTAVGPFHFDVRLDFTGLVRLLALVHRVARTLARHLHPAHGQYPGHKQHRQHFSHYFSHIFLLIFSHILQNSTPCAKYKGTIISFIIQIFLQKKAPSLLWGSGPEGYSPPGLAHDERADGVDLLAGDADEVGALRKVSE